MDYDTHIAVMKVIRQRNWANLKALLDKDILTPEEDEFWLLEMVCHENWIDGLKSLVKDYAVNPAATFRCLREATYHEDLELMKFLVLECKVDIAERDYCAMRCAILKDNLPAVQFLHSQGLPLDIKHYANSLKLKGAKQKRVKTSLFIEGAWQHDAQECFSFLFANKTLRKNFFKEGHVLSENNILNKRKVAPAMVELALSIMAQEAPEEYRKVKENYKDAEHQAFFLWLDLQINCDPATQGSVRKRKI